MDVSGKIAVVTGASSGIGEATAKLLTQKGAKVALVARSLDKLQELSKALPDSFVFKANMSQVAEVCAMVREVSSHFGRIDILVNNAGRGYDTQIEKIDIQKFHDLFDLDVVGPLVAMQEVIPLMRQQQQGSIVNISSGTALMALPNMAAYSSLKRALVGLSLTAREELKKDHISVSIVYPFITATNFEENTMKDFDEEEWEGEDDREIPPADTPEYVAQKILEAITTGKPEVFAHDWMEK